MPRHSHRPLTALALLRTLDLESQPIDFSPLSPEDRTELIRLTALLHAQLHTASTDEEPLAPPRDVGPDDST